MNNPKDTTGKRWWEVLFDEDYPFGIYRSAESENPFMRSSVKLDNCKKELKSSIAKIEEQAFRKGVEASLGALSKKMPRTGDMEKGFNKAISEAKENIGNLIK